MHPRLEQQLRLSIRDRRVDTDLLIRLVDTAYREDDSRFHMLIDRINDAVLVLDGRNNVIMVNLAARKMLGLQPGMLQLGALADYAPGLQLDESLQDAQGAMLADGRNVACQCNNETTFPGRVTVFTLRVGERGQRIALIQKEEQQISEETVQRMRQDAGISERYLAMTSHELRTPMNAVLGMARHLITSQLTPDQRESVKTIIDAGDVMMTLLNDLLDKSKIDAGKMRLRNVNVDVRHMIRKLERLWRPTVETGTVTFLTRVDENVPSVVKGDPIRLRQILSNLISNASKHTSEGSIVLHVSMRGQTDTHADLAFMVRDTGTGMDKRTLAHLFDDYEQGDTTSARDLGTGLGLSISRELVRLMNGDLTVDSSEGLGSVFTMQAPFRLGEDNMPGNAVAPAQKAQEAAPTPVAHLPHSEPKTSAPTTITPSSAPSTGMPMPPASEPAISSAMTPAPEKVPAAPVMDEPGSVRILAVEDNPINQRVLAAFLRPIGGEVVWASNGQEALDTLGAGRFDVVLMDIQMPVMDGLAATRRLRASQSPNANVPVVAMTANAMIGDRETCLAAGMNDYVSKPVDPKTLYKVISRLIDESRRSPEGFRASA